VNPSKNDWRATHGRAFLQLMSAANRYPPPHIQVSSLIIDPAIAGNIDRYIGKSLSELNFQTNDSASFRYHTDDDNLLQVIYQIFSAYFTYDHADELTNEPVFTTILDKTALASQPTLSRF